MKSLLLPLAALALTAAPDSARRSTAPGPALLTGPVNGVFSAWVDGYGSRGGVRRPGWRVPPLGALK